MSISLNEALNKSEYDEFIKDKVKSFVLENYKNYKDKSNLYLTKCFNKKIFVIKMDLYVTYKDTGEVKEIKLEKYKVQRDE